MLKSATLAFSQARKSSIWLFSMKYQCIFIKLRIMGVVKDAKGGGLKSADYNPAN